MNRPVVQLSVSRKTGRRKSAPVPPLENGDRLTRDEFHRRYVAMPETTRAELIEGVVYMSSPVSVSNHGEPQGDLIGVLWVYKASTRGVRMADNSTVYLDRKNEVQPDGFLFLDPALGGQVKIEKGYIVGGPELAAEIAASSVSIDLGAKKKAYRRNGVREYVVWRVLDEAIDWFVLRNNKFKPLPRHHGVYRSEVFPGLWLDADALVRGDLPQVHQVLQEGLASAEHQDFVAKLSV